MFHESAQPSHYDSSATNYDAFNDEHSSLINQVLIRLLRDHQVKSVCDLTCGTGAQVFQLLQHGFHVVGADFSRSMLSIAKEKAKAALVDVRFQEGDVRTVQAGEFDAAITIFNAIGHLTTADFELALRNIHTNLAPGGIYVFDIFNLRYLLHEQNITRLTIDWIRHEGSRQIREIQYSTVDETGVLASYTASIVGTAAGELSRTAHSQTLQVYSAEMLRSLLPPNGFEVLGQYGVDGTPFLDEGTERILTVARRTS